MILGCHVVTVTCLISSSTSCSTSSSIRWNRKKKSKSIHQSTNDGPKVTYPIIQIYFNSELKTELFCDDDIALFVKKVSSYLTQLDYDVSDVMIKASGSDYVYSDDQLKREMASHGAVILKVFRQSCVKCVQFDEHYYDLVNAEKLSKYRWIQADASNIPAFVDALKLRLLGNVVSDDDSNLIENCAVCNNSGFTICSSCDGKGLVSRGPNTVFCPTCVGYKKVRCQNCGGKCIRCAL